MPQNRGKSFESKLKEDFQKIPNSHIERIYDSMSGYKSIKGRSDFIAYIKPNMYFIEAKSHYGNTFPFSALTQYESLLEVSGIDGIRSGVIVWMIDHYKVFYIPVRTIKSMKEDNLKSFNINKTDFDKYKIIEIPSVRKRIYLDSNYLILKNLEEGD